MGLIPAVALALACISCFHIRICIGKAEHRLHHETSDVGKVLENFIDVIAILDVDNDGDLDCLSAVRTDYDSSVPRAAYVWMLPGVNGRRPINITYDVVPGASPDLFRFWDRDGDGTVQHGRYVYTDYKDCFVMYLYEMEECMLWTSRDVKDGVPQTCVDYYEDNCDVGRVSYDKDTCSVFFDL